MSWADEGDQLTEKEEAALIEQLQGTSIPKHDDVDEDEEDVKLATRTAGLIESTQEAVIESDSPLVSATTFPELGLSEEILQGVFAKNFNKPSKIQGLAIPAILKNPPMHFIGQAQSGTGKTGAFTLSMLGRIDPNQHTCQALCVAPTRELARQIYSVVEELSKFTKIKTLLVVPDAKIPQKVTQHLVVGTPGKICGLVERRNLNMKTIKIFVLDEADQMLDMQGMQTQSKKIRKKLPNTCQVCLFSATYSEEVSTFAEGFVPNPKTTIYIPPEKLTLDKLAQFYIDCGSAEKKFEVLDEIYGYVNVGQSIIFVQTRATAQRLCAYMKSKTHEVSLLHGGDMNVNERDRVIDAFRKGETRVLITTNVLARGVDVLQVTLVINFDIPLNKARVADPETYLHRIGRSARYGNSGVAINMVHDVKSKGDLQAISNHFNKKIENLPVDDIERIGDLLDKLA